jgi:voltage-gated potassium channel
MTDSTDSSPDAPGEGRAPVRTMVWTGLRALGNTAALVAIYYLLPLDHTSTAFAATILIIGLVAFIALVIFQEGYSKPQVIEKKKSARVASNAS